MPINLHRFSLGNVPKFAWPGGYPIVAIMDDGEHVCADCLNDATNPLHFGASKDGKSWKDRRRITMALLFARIVIRLSSRTSMEIEDVGYALLWIAIAVFFAASIYVGA